MEKLGIWWLDVVITSAKIVVTGWLMCSWSEFYLYIHVSSIVLWFDVFFYILDTLIHVTTLVEESTIITHMYRIVLLCDGFFVVPFYTGLNYDAKMVTLEIPYRERSELQRVYKTKLAKIISFIQARELEGKDYLA